MSMAIITQAAPGADSGRDDRLSPRNPAARMAARQDLASMLLPLFPEDGARRLDAEVDGELITVSVERDGLRCATPGDRRLLNVIAGALAAAIRSGAPPSRRVEIELRLIHEALAIDDAGGAEYGRLVQRLQRLMATVVETRAAAGGDLERLRRFRWIDGYEHIDLATEGSRRMLALRITLSEEAFAIVTRGLGFDVEPEQFRAMAARPTSTWRIYEVCLALLARSGAPSLSVPIAELRDRIPISSELKVFKSRTLRAAMAAIAACPTMSDHIALDLERHAPGRPPAATDFSARAPLDEIHVRVRRGRSPLPRMNVLLRAHDAAPLGVALDPLPSGRPAMS